MAASVHCTRASEGRLVASPNRPEGARSFVLSTLQIPPRQDRRKARVDYFRKHDARGRRLLTHLVDIKEDLTGLPRPKLMRGATDLLMLQCQAGGWRVCIACEIGFDADTMPAAVLIAIPVAADARAATASGICATCWRDRSVAEIDDAATRTLREILPNGRFLDSVVRA